MDQKRTGAPLGATAAADEANASSTPTESAAASSDTNLTDYVFWSRI
jgi:hypothetical protein